MTRLRAGAQPARARLIGLPQQRLPHHLPSNSVSEQQGQRIYSPLHISIRLSGVKSQRSPSRCLSWLNLLPTRAGQPEVLLSTSISYVVLL